MDYGDASESEEREIPGKEGILGSDTPLPVGPGPGAGGPAIPADDYGLAGIFALSGKFTKTTVARIVVGSTGYYELHREWAAGDWPPEVTWTCVHLKEFTGLPHPSTFTTNGPHALTTKGGPRVEKQLTTADPIWGFAAPWAGVAGSLSTPIPDQENMSYAWHDEGSGGSITWLGAQAAQESTISSFAFCNAFSGPFIWRFFKASYGDVFGDGQANHKFLPVRQEKYWCYMEGVAAGYGNVPAGYGSIDDITASFTAALGVDNHPPPPYDSGGPIYYEDVNNALLYWNALPLEQPG